MRLFKDKIIFGIHKTYDKKSYILFGQLYSGYCGFIINLKGIQVNFWIYKPENKFPRLKLWGIGI